MNLLYNFIITCKQCYKYMKTSHFILKTGQDIVDLVILPCISNVNQTCKDVIWPKLYLSIKEG